MSNWTVTFSRDARKQYEKLKRSGSKKPSVIDAVDLLAMDLEKTDLIYIRGLTTAH